MAKVFTTSAWLPAFGLRARRRAGLKLKVAPAFAAKNYNNLVMARSPKAGARREAPALVYVLAAANLVFIALYFFGINQYTAKGYELRQAQNRLSALQDENKKLILRTSENVSLLQLQDSLAAEHFVPVTAAEFVQLNQYSQR